MRAGAALLRGLDFQELAREGMCVAAAHTHAFARRRSVSLVEVAQEPLIALSRQEYPDYHELLEGFFVQQKAKPRIAEEHDSVSSLIASVEAGNGVAIVAESIDCIAGARLKLVPLLPAVTPIIIGAAWEKKRRLGAVAQKFLDCARLASRTGAERFRTSYA